MSILDELEPPQRKDFRRVGRGTPYVLDPNGKRTRYRRHSNAGKILDDASNLVDWRIRTIVFGASQRPDLMAQVSTLDQEEDKKEIRDISEELLVAGKGQQRATTGTAIHRMLDHVDMEDGWMPAPQFKDAVEAYVRVRDAYGLVPIDIEVQCINDEYRLAGTADRRYRTTKALVAPDGQIIPIGSVLLGDTKTGRTLEYAAGSYATQLAGYVDSLRYDSDTDERSVFDPPTFKDWAIIVHLNYDEPRCEIYWVDMEAGRNGLKLASLVRHWQQAEDLILPARIPLHAVQDEVKQDDAIKAEEAASDIQYELRQWLLRRIANVKEAGQPAIAGLLRNWPKDVPGMKTDHIHTEYEMDAISEALWQTEKEYTLPFPGNDPRAPKDDGDGHLHKHPRAHLVQELAHLIHADVVGSKEVMDAISRFCLLSEDFSDRDVQEMLDGTLRATGYEHGIMDLSIVKAEHAAYIESARFALATGTAMLLFDEHERPIVRVITNERPWA